MNARTMVWLLVLLGMPLSAAALEVGDMAPDFELQGTDGNVYRLSDFRGEETVVLAWYPAAFTRGCTLECRSLAENGHLIREYRVSYFMASVDPIDVNRDFAEEMQADFPLLSDPDRTAAAAYEVLNERGVANRNTFYIGPDGRILAIDTEVEPATAAENIAARLAELDVPRN